MLRFNKDWRFDSPGPVAHGVVDDFLTIIGKVASQTHRQEIFEHFKSYFAAAAGFTSNRSSDGSWAKVDLDSYARNASANAPLFIEGFYEACEAARERWPEIAVPDVRRINRILAQRDAGYEIAPPNLLARNQALAIEVPEALSFDEQARRLIEQSLRHSEQLLMQEHNRQAVQELLWLLETVSTAFQGVGTEAGTVQGKYFNRIAEDLRRRQKGKTIEHVLSWVTTLHGYLSSPTGGGIRHGIDLNAGVAIGATEARLFCNLIRSYIWFLLDEHRRLTQSDH